MPERILKAAEPINAAIDGTTLTGAGASTVGWIATFGQYYPMITGSMAFIVMLLTIVHLFRRIKNSNLDEEIKIQTIELNNIELQRRHDDQHDPTED